MVNFVLLSPNDSMMFLYFYRPDNVIYEYSYGVMRVEDESRHLPRHFPFTSSSFYVRGAVPNIKEFSKK
jgi:hypothetical protein